MVGFQATWWQSEGGREEEKDSFDGGLQLDRAHKYAEVKNNISSFRVI